MSFQDQMEELETWAAINRTDCQLAGADQQAHKFDMVCQVVDLVHSLQVLVAKHEEALKYFEAEIKRLETLAHRA